MRRAVQDVTEHHMKLRQAAERNNVKFQTLARYVLKQKRNPDVEHSFKPKYDTRRVFTNNQEQLLKDYIFKCSKMCYGQSTKDVRELAYELCIANNIKMPHQWTVNKRALTGYKGLESGIPMSVLDNQRRAACREQRLLIHTMLKYFSTIWKMSCEDHLYLLMAAEFIT